MAITRKGGERGNEREGKSERNCREISEEKFRWGVMEWWRVVRWGGTRSMRFASLYASYIWILGVRSGFSEWIEHASETQAVKVGYVARREFGDSLVDE